MEPVTISSEPIAFAAGKSKLDTYLGLDVIQISTDVGEWPNCVRMQFGMPRANACALAKMLTDAAAKSKEAIPMREIATIADSSFGTPELFSITEDTAGGITLYASIDGQESGLIRIPPELRNSIAAAIMSLQMVPA